jgi:hypothetical protein
MNARSTDSIRMVQLSLWVEGVLISAGVLYWLVVDPAHLLRSGLFLGLGVLVVLGLVSAVALYLLTRGASDPLEQLDRRSKVDMSIREMRK